MPPPAASAALKAVATAVIDLGNSPPPLLTLTEYAKNTTTTLRKDKLFMILHVVVREAVLTYTSLSVKLTADF